MKGSPCPLTPEYFAVLKLLASNNVREAALKLFDTNPLPAVTSRLAPEFYLETQVYNRKAERISLRAIERFLADHLKPEKHVIHGSAARSKLKIAVIGSGPAGLTAAAFLSRQGYGVTVVDSSVSAGGSLSSLYPVFRLPGKVFETALSHILAGGVELRLNTLFPRILSLGECFDEAGFSAVLLAAGAGLPQPMAMAGDDAAGVMSAAQMLWLTRSMKVGQEGYTTPVFLGGKVVVVGHNEMAFDAARTAVRFGKSVTMVIAGSEADIKVRPDIVREAAEEGIKFSTFAVPVSVKTDSSFCAKALRCRHLDYRVDEAGRLTVVEEENAEFELEADTIIVSKEARANTLFAAEVPGLDLNLDGSVWVKPDSSFTSVRKLFACGQVVRPGFSLLETMVDARRAAMEIHTFLNP